ncbi:putative metalloprotease [Mycobacteroides abscessus subsp. abscessus]|uniref:hypothetical protein n=1 Tax=Mycobacteroides abscessus TaxID=36809 RepID=UPI000927EA67|nr:hypothetical protein [Mycobacteroides abscessus]SIC63367.1 putative metalloprotease [Mycobacteroides abscessus subsp. abscessus]SIG64231.1 putative metalloprotease [Mycobacteroides abscessus subsp. abscessus]
MTTYPFRASIASLAATLTLTSCGSLALIPEPDIAAGDTTSTSTTPSDTPTEDAATLPEVEGTDGGDVDRIAAQTVAEMQELVDLPSTLRVVSWDSTKPQGKSWCRGEIKDTLSNAVVCRVDPLLIGWDRTFLRKLHDANGDLGIALVIAHEMGHVADVTSDAGEGASVIVREQRADCVAGVYIRAQRDAGDIPEDAVGNAFLAMLSFADAPLKPGQNPADAHGTGGERLSAMLQGFNGDVDTCLSITQPEVDDRRLRLPLTVAAGEGDMAWTPRVIDGAYATAVAFTGGIEPPRFVFTPCVPGDRPATICPDGSVYVTPESLTEYTDTIRRAATTRVGDGTGLGPLVNTVANRWLVSQGVPATGEQAALRAACVVGITLARMTIDIGAPILLSAGDVDEALTEVLVRGLTTSDRDGLVPPSVPDRVAAFLAGVYTVTGPGACVTLYPESR